MYEHRVDSPMLHDANPSKGWGQIPQSMQTSEGYILIETEDLKTLKVLYLNGKIKRGILRVGNTETLRCNLWKYFSLYMILPSPFDGFAGCGLYIKNACVNSSLCSMPQCFLKRFFLKFRYLVINRYIHTVQLFGSINLDNISECESCLLGVHSGIKQIKAYGHDRGPRLARDLDLIELTDESRTSSLLVETPRFAIDAEPILAARLS